MANTTANRVDGDLDAQSPAADLVRVYLNGIGKTALLESHDTLADCARFQEAALGGWVWGSDDFVLHLQQLTGRRLQKTQAGRPPKRSETVV